ncbi:MAG TPA: nuclear transport factor 2 family protein [Longimicrobiales bacterium]|nr:nuclear transport factor 2 family protein [Longimicrobiales bacterium]
MPILGLLLVLAACVAEPPSRGDEPVDDEAAVLEVIRGETEAFWEKDYDKWASHWSHEPYVRLMGWWEAGGVSVAEGWETVGGNMRRLMDENPEPNPTSGAVRRENINVRISGTMAMVTFDQYGLDTGEAAMDMPGLSRETRVLEKHDGQWKIIYVGFLLEG